MNVQDLSQALSKTLSSKLQTNTIAQNDAYAEVTIEVAPAELVSV